jgi:sec-independent protein translocase protein TatA
MNAPTLAFLGWPEIVAILVIVLILFGAKKLPELAKGLGQGIKEFKKASADVQNDLRRAVEEEYHEPPPPPAPRPPQQPPSTAA